MGDTNQSICDVAEYNEIQLAEAEPGATMAKMINHLNIWGVSQPEIFAEGLCPNCKTRLDLWISGQGLELSLHGNGYIKELPNQKGNTAIKAWDTRAENPPAPKPIIMDVPLPEPEPMNATESLSGFVTDLLLKTVPCSINLKRMVFFTLLILASTALLIQAAYFFWPAIWEPRIIALDTNWMAIIRTLILILLVLAAVNFLTYKFRSSDSGPNQIDRWTLASSIIIVDYYLLSYIALPLLLIYQLNLPL